MKIHLDRARCCGNLECVRIAPAIFTEDESGLGLVKLETPVLELESAARLAADSCPAGAITVVDNDC